MSEKIMAATDIENKCFTCAPLQKYVDLTQQFTDELSKTLHEPMLLLFSALAALWIVITGIKLALHITDKKQIITDFSCITITGILLGSQATGVISYIYSASLSIMSGAATSVFSIAGDAAGSSGHTGLVALAANGEKAVFKVFQAGGALASSFSFSVSSAANIIYAAILVIPYFLLVVAYASQVVVAIFRATMVGVFAPFLFMSFAFGWGREMAKAGAKTLFSSTCVLFACTASLALTIYGVKSLPLEPNDLSGGTLGDFASITNPDFLVIMFLGWAGTALMAEGTSISNSISGTFLKDSGAGVLTSGTAASAGMALKHGLPTARKIMGSTAHGYFAGQQMMADPSAAVQNLVDRFRNPNQPNS